MKALFNRFNNRLLKDKNHNSNNNANADSHSTREKVPELPRLPEWPPAQRVTSTTSTVHDFKPLPEISSRPLPPIEASSLLVPDGEPESRASTTSTRTHDGPSSSSAAPGEPLERIVSTMGGQSQTSSTRTEPDNTTAHTSSMSNGRTNGGRKTTAGSSSGSDTQNPRKQVAFLSPPPTPAPLDRTQQPDAATLNGDATSSRSVPGSSSAKSTTVSRFQGAQLAEGRGSTSSAASSSRVNVAASAPKGMMKVTSTRIATSPISQKTFAESLNANHANLNATLRSTTPYSQTSQSTSRILATPSWSEAAEEDLVSNLGPRERTRQEVLWEIVASEERYVLELTKLKETFIDPLLHPYHTSPVSSPNLMDHDRVDMYHYRVESPQESLDNLPIASRFLSPTPGLRSETPATIHQNQYGPASPKDSTPNIDGESAESDDEALDKMGRGFSRSGYTGNGGGGVATRKPSAGLVASAVSKFDHPRSPYNTGAARTKDGAGEHVPFPSRSQQLVSATMRGNNNHAHFANASSASLGRQSYIGGLTEKERDNVYASRAAHASAGRRDAMPGGATSGARGMLRKLKRSPTTPDFVNTALPPHQLPEDLRRCLEVIEDGIYNGHVILSEGLRKRYEEQYPLVRSLADVFVSNSHILREYATYVLHLERALEQVDDALSTLSDTKKPKKQDAADWLKVCKTLQRLEEDAAEKGETGLAISLSKPFQRLLKYPLLFQNLLYHTDPSTYEYESTLAMVAEVETIVRSIEDEKIQKEERDKTRDAFARIEGLEKVRQLALPKPSRLLVEEKPVDPIYSPPASTGVANSRSPPVSGMKNVKGKPSLKRLSDVLAPSGGGIGGKKDLWFVQFNDVILRCQRTGVTSLPLASTVNSRVNSMPELHAGGGKAGKYASVGRRGAAGRARNLYKFIKIENWAIADAVDRSTGVVSMEDVVRSRAQVHSGVPSSMTPREEDEDEDEDLMDSDDSDRKSKMSFSYWGADKITVRKPAVIPVPSKGRSTPGGGGGASSSLRKGAGTPSGYSRESSANAKFGTRLLPHEAHSHGSAGGTTGARAPSRRTQATPSSRRAPHGAGTSGGAHSEDGHATATATTTKVTITSSSGRPDWNGSTRTATTTPTARPRVRNVSQTSGKSGAAAHANGAVRGGGLGGEGGGGSESATRTPAPRASKTSLAAPSEDSGVGLYRQMLAQDSSLRV